MFLINNIGPISCILVNWIECCSRRLLTRPWIILTSPAPFDIWWKGWSAWTFRYLWWHIGPFCHDTFVSDEEVGNHIDNRHHLNDSHLFFLSKIFQRKGWSDWTYGGTDVTTNRNFQCNFFLSRNLYEYWEFCDTHLQSPVVQMQTLLFSFLCFVMHLFKLVYKLHSSQRNVNTSC